jgi:hypothetical protein
MISQFIPHLPDQSIVASVLSYSKNPKDVFGTSILNQFLCDAFQTCICMSIETVYFTCMKVVEKNIFTVALTLLTPPMWVTVSHADTRNSSIVPDTVEKCEKQWDAAASLEQESRKWRAKK